MEEGGSKVKQVLSNLWSYLYRILPPTEDFIIQLDIGGIIDRDSDAPKLRASARLGDRACIHDLITHMYNFFNEKALEKFCTFLDKYGQSTSRPLMLEVAAKIREEIGFKLQPVHELAPEDPQKGTSRADVAHGTSSADMSQHDVYYPVIDDLKPSFSNLAGNVLSTIDLLSSKNLKTFCNNFLLNYLKPSFPPNAPLPVIPKTVEDLKPFLASRWDPLQIALLKAVVERLASRNIQGGNFKATVKKVKYELNAYEDLLKRKLPEFLSECKSESVYLKSYPGQSSVSAKIASNPAEISLSRIMKLKGFFIHNLGFRYTLFTGFSEGCIVLFFSIPTECVWSLPSCLHPSNLSQLEEWKVLFLSVEGAFTVDIKERRVIDSLDKHSLLSSLSEDKAVNEADLRTKEMVQQLQDQKEELEKEITSLKETLSKDGQSRMLSEILESVKSELPEQISAFGKDSAQLQQNNLHAAELKEKDETIARKNKEIGELKLAEKNDLKSVLVALRTEIAENKADVRHALKEVGGGGPAELEAKKLISHFQDVREQLDLIRGLLEEKDTQRQKKYTVLREVATQVQEDDTLLQMDSDDLPVGIPERQPPPRFEEKDNRVQHPFIETRSQYMIASEPDTEIGTEETGTPLQVKAQKFGAKALKKQSKSLSLSEVEDVREECDDLVQQSETIHDIFSRPLHSQHQAEYDDEQLEEELARIMAEPDEEAPLNGNEEMMLSGTSPDVFDPQPSPACDQNKPEDGLHGDNNAGGYKKGRDGDRDPDIPGIGFIIPFVLPIPAVIPPVLPVLPPPFVPGVPPVVKNPFGKKGSSDDKPSKKNEGKENKKQEKKKEDEKNECKEEKENECEEEGDKDCKEEHEDRDPERPNLSEESSSEEEEEDKTEKDPVTLLQEKDTKLQEKDTQIAKLLEEIQRLEQENNQQEKDTQHLDPELLLYSRPKTGTPVPEIGTQETGTLLQFTYLERDPQSKEGFKLTQPGENEEQHVDCSTAQAVTMEEGESKVKQVLSTLWSYLYSSLPPNEDFIIQLEISGILARNDATRLRASARLGGRACIQDLIIFMYDFFDEPALETFCTFLDKYGQPTRTPMLEVAARIREEIGLKPQQDCVVIPEDPQREGTSRPRADVGDGTSSADVSQHVYYPVIDDLKSSFSNLAGNVLSIIGSLPSENLETFCYFLSSYLKPSFPPDAPLPVIPETVQDLKLFLICRWDPLQIALLKAVVEHLAYGKIQDATVTFHYHIESNVQQVKADLNTYEDLLKGKLLEFLSECRSERVSLQSYPGQSSVSVKIASNPAEISLSRIVKLKNFFIHNLNLPDTLFAGYSEG